MILTERSIDPDSESLVSGARDLVQELHARGVPLYLVSKAEESRPRILEELGLNQYFVESFFVEHKDPTLFFEILKNAKVHPKEMYVIGDHLHKEIRWGNQCGMRTIWFKNGKFAELEPATLTDQPWQTISELSDALKLIV